MYIDYQNLFSNRQAVTASAVSENIIDTGRNLNGKSIGIGSGYPIEVVCMISETLVGVTKLAVELQTAETEDFSDAVVLQTAYLTGAEQMTAGTQAPLSTLPVNCKRFLRLNYKVTAGTPESGSITAGLVLDRETNR